MPKANKNFYGNIYIVLALRLLTIFGLFMLCRFIFYGFNSSYFPAPNFNKWLVFIRGGLRFDMVAILYTNSLYILLSIIPFRFKYLKPYQNGLKSLFFITNGIALLSNCIDFIYFRFTLKRTTWSSFTEIATVDSLPTLLGKYLFSAWPVLLIWLALVALMVYVNWHIKIKQNSNTDFRFYVMQSLMMLVIIAMFIGGVRGGDFRHSTRPITLSNAGEYVAQPKEMFIVLNTPFCIFKTLSKSDYQHISYYKSEKELNAIYSPIHYPDSSQRAFRPMNVVILIVESLSKEAVGGYNKGIDKGYTPFIDSLMQASKVYWYATANGSRSIEALPSILTSIPSIQEAFVLTKYTSNKLNSLPNILREKGYSTSFFHGAANGSMGFQAFTNLMGIQNYYGRTEYNNDADYDGSWGIWDEEFLQFMVNKLNTFKQPFFSTVFTLSSHEPCVLPKRYEGKFKVGPLKISPLWGYTDMAIRKFFEKAKTMPWYNNTLFILTADHASTFASHPEYANSVGNFQIPILFYQPNDAQLKGIEYKLVQQIDIMPSVLGYLNYDSPYFAFGKNVFDDRRPSADHLDFAVNYDGGYQWYKGNYVLLFNGNKSVGLYDFAADKLLKNNKLGKLPELQNLMETELKAFIQQYNNRMLADKLYYQEPK